MAGGLLLGSLRFLGPAMQIGQANSEYKKMRAERPHESRAKAAIISGGKGAIRAAGWIAAPKLMMIGGLTSAASSLGGFIASTHAQGVDYKRYNPRFGGNFMDTEMTATMRQRSLQAMHNSRMNTRSILGNEARSLHSTRSW